MDEPTDDNTITNENIPLLLHKTTSMPSLRLIPAYTRGGQRRRLLLATAVSVSESPTTTVDNNYRVRSHTRNLDSVGNRLKIYRTAQSIESGDDDGDNDDRDENGNKSSSPPSKKLSSLTANQWATIITLSIANFCSTVAFSCIAPFYPEEATEKGLNESQIGIVFGIFELVMLISAPILGKYLVKIGSKFMFTSGLVITGITSIAFGFLNQLPPGAYFFWLSLILRCIEALGDAAFVTSSFAISAYCFPGRISTIIGVLETFAGLGYTAGPAIGGMLYEFGGFQLPFTVLGSLMLIATIMAWYLIDEYDDEQAIGSKGVLGMLRIPTVIVMVSAAMLCALSFAFLDPTLSDHLQSFHLSPTIIGLFFLICGGFYTVTAPLCGILTDRFNCGPITVIVGAALSAISMATIGPLPLIGMEKNLYVIGGSLMVLGFASSALYVPGFNICLRAVRANGYEDNFETYGAISGVFQSAYATGAFIGPTIGGAIVQYIGFAWTSSIIALLHLIYMSVLLFYYALGRSRKCNFAVTNTSQ